MLWVPYVIIALATTVAGGSQPALGQRLGLRAELLDSNKKIIRGIKDWVVIAAHVATSNPKGVIGALPASWMCDGALSEKQRNNKQGQNATCARTTRHYVFAPRSYLKCGRSPLKRILLYTSRSIAPVISYSTYRSRKQNGNVMEIRRLNNRTVRAQAQQKRTEQTSLADNCRGLCARHYGRIGVDKRRPPHCPREIAGRHSARLLLIRLCL
ncbi:hypothetical protein EVAR_22751_1 [Eumeta japonica]|uniref:Uncharacterized protein n=1 Tax=Eumeta variegata TaxID=151549 RepID=A0A4C1USU2_EUMVA|nr:hypothetical protein EVAR_22751_1 [Eumeta japonica]